LKFNKPDEKVKDEDDAFEVYAFEK